MYREYGAVFPVGRRTAASVGSVCGAACAGSGAFQLCVPAFESVQQFHQRDPEKRPDPGSGISANIIEGLLNHVFEHFENASEELVSDLLTKIREERMIKIMTEYYKHY